jgi:hypothetical protein
MMHVKANSGALPALAANDEAPLRAPAKFGQNGVASTCREDDAGPLRRVFAGRQVWNAGTPPASRGV